MASATIHPIVSVPMTGPVDRSRLGTSVGVCCARSLIRATAPHAAIAATSAPAMPSTSIHGIACETPSEATTTDAPQTARDDGRGSSLEDAAASARAIAPRPQTRGPTPPSARMATATTYPVPARRGTSPRRAARNESFSGYRMQCWRLL